MVNQSHLFHEMKDKYCSYYTENHDISMYMVEKLKLAEGDVILEPAAGNGALIDAVLRTGIKVSIDAYDIDVAAINKLVRTYKDSNNVSIFHEDTLTSASLDAKTNGVFEIYNENASYADGLDLMNGYYTKIIGNPPYGAWQEYDRRAYFKKKYHGIYAKETYSLFLLRCLSLLKNDGILSFIIPDTFLFLNNHKNLRRILLNKFHIIEILIFPSQLFPGVNFSYSNLSIITIQKKKVSPLDNVINIYTGFTASDQFATITSSSIDKSIEVYRVRQGEILKNENHSFILADDSYTNLLQNKSKSLGDVADVVTGLCTGDNTKFLAVRDHNVKNSTNYNLISNHKIINSKSTSGEDAAHELYIPYVKGTPEHMYFMPPTNWFIRWDVNAVNAYKSEKKARFQNSQYYFRSGIGVPMVKSAKVKAFLMQDSVFDQSIVGIFPKDSKKIYYILGLINSEVINKIIHLINPTANNSANYLKLIPYIEPSETELHKISSIVEQIIQFGSNADPQTIGRLHAKLSAIFNDIYFPKHQKNCS